MSSTPAVMDGRFIDKDCTLKTECKLPTWAILQRIKKHFCFQNSRQFIAFGIEMELCYIIKNGLLRFEIWFILNTDSMSSNLNPQPGEQNGN
jgi:hypothetical protein